jgi:hypothetical protein
MVEGVPGRQSAGQVTPVAPSMSAEIKIRMAPRYALPSARKRML